MLTYIHIFNCYWCLIHVYTALQLFSQWTPLFYLKHSLFVSFIAMHLNVCTCNEVYILNKILKCSLTICIYVIYIYVLSIDLSLRGFNSVYLATVVVYYRRAQAVTLQPVLRGAGRLLRIHNRMMTMYISKC